MYYSRHPVVQQPLKNLQRSQTELNRTKDRVRDWLSSPSHSQSLPSQISNRPAFHGATAHLDAAQPLAEKDINEVACHSIPS
jgi:hypothetical protein